MTVQEAAIGDPTPRTSTVESTALIVRGINRGARRAEELCDAVLTEWVADKRHDPNKTMEMVAEVGLRSHVSRPQRGLHGRLEALRTVLRVLAAVRLAASTGC